ncbi:MAG: hypothetical protein E7F64_02915 [Clostridiales bacterium]|nr:hypothetical protein [Clostridiales bacterium]
MIGTVLESFISAVTFTFVLESSTEEFLISFPSASYSFRATSLFTFPSALETSTTALAEAIEET